LNPPEFMIIVKLLVRRTDRMNYSDVDFFDDVSKLVEMTEHEYEYES